MEKKPILCVDFDGVIHSYISGWNGARNIPDPPIRGALEFLVLATKYFEVNIYSSRSRYFGARRAMKKYLFKHYFKISELDAREIPRWFWSGIPEKNSTQIWRASAKTGIKIFLKKLKFPIKKPAAFLTIDDRVHLFTGIFPYPKSLLDFEPWNKKKKYT